MCRTHCRPLAYWTEPAARDWSPPSPRSFPQPAQHPNSVAGCLWHKRKQPSSYTRQSGRWKQLCRESDRRATSSSRLPPGPKDWVDRFGDQPRKGADILVQCLEREGVDSVFAYPGGASMEIHQALTRSDRISNVLCRHEQVRAARRAAGDVRAKQGAQG